MNSLVLAGVISSESQLKYSKEGKAICEFYLNFTSPGSPESWNQIKCVSFGKIAEASAQIREGENIICVGAINVTNKEYQGVKSRLVEFKIQHVETTPALVSVNVVNLVGRAGRDPEVKYFESGTNKCAGSLAVRRTSELADWLDWEAWGKVGEIMGNYVRKGGLVGINGALKFDKWNDRNSGELKIKPVIVVNQMDLLSEKKQQESGYDESDDICNKV